MATGALAGPPAFGLIDNEPQNFAISPSISDDGRCLAFHARGHNAFTGAAGDITTAYVYVLAAAARAAGERRRARPGRGARREGGDHARVAAPQALPRRQAGDREARRAPHGARRRAPRSASVSARRPT